NERRGTSRAGTPPRRVAAGGCAWWCLWWWAWRWRAGAGVVIGPLCRNDAGCATPEEVQPAVTSISAATVRYLTSAPFAARCRPWANRTLAGASLAAHATRDPARL